MSVEYTQLDIVATTHGAKPHNPGIGSPGDVGRGRIGRMGSVISQALGAKQRPSTDTP